MTTLRFIEFLLYLFLFIDFVDYKLTLSLTSKLTKQIRVWLFEDLDFRICIYIVERRTSTKSTNDVLCHVVYLHCPFKLDETLLITLTYKQNRKEKKHDTEFHAIRFWSLCSFFARSFILYGCFECLIRFFLVYFSPIYIYLFALFLFNDLSTTYFMNWQRAFQFMLDWFDSIISNLFGSIGFWGNWLKSYQMCNDTNFEWNGSKWTDSLCYST